MASNIMLIWAVFLWAANSSQEGIDGWIFFHRCTMSIAPPCARGAGLYCWGQEWCPVSIFCPVKLILPYGVPPATECVNNINNSAYSSRSHNVSFVINVATLLRTYPAHDFLRFNIFFLSVGWYLDMAQECKLQLVASDRTLTPDIFYRPLLGSHDSWYFSTPDSIFWV